jgi:PAS domain S-box-containing protein
MRAPVLPVVLVLGLALTAGAQPTPAEPGPGPRLIYGGDDDFPPYEYLDASGRPQGFNVRLVSLLAQRAGYQLEIRLQAWRDTLNQFERGQIDLITAAWSESRAQRYAYLPQVWTLRQAVIFPAGRERYPTSMADLGNEIVAIEERSVVHEMLAALPEVQRPVLVPLKGQREGLALVRRGEATATAGNALTLRHFLAQGGSQAVAEVLVKSIPYHLVTRRGHEATLAPIASAFDAARASGELNALVESYLVAPPGEGGWRQYLDYVLGGGAAVLLLVLGVGAWNWSLRRQVRERTRDLTRAQENLERRVVERTQALAQANRALEADVLERRRTEEALRRSQARLGAAIRGARLSFWEFKVKCETVEVDPEVMAAFGYAPDDFANRAGWSSVVHPDDLPVLERAFADHLHGRTPFVELEFRLRTRDGGWRWAGLDGRVTARDESGAPSHIAGIVRDVTDRKRLEGQLLQAQRLDGLGRLAGGVAHDFNNLLTAMLGHVELLQQETPDDDPRQDDLREIAEAGARASTLTRQLLAFARRQPVAARDVDLNVLVGGLERLLRRLLGEDVELRTELADGLWAVRVDPGQLEQVVLNLAVNGRDAMPRGGTLVIATRNVDLSHDVSPEAQALPPGAYVRLAVTDTGTGIDAADLHHIFEPFFTTKEFGKGTGLGLATTYGIATQAGGTVTVRSTPGVGTEFAVWLPARPVVVVPAAAGAVHDAPVQVRGRETILVAEDEPQVRALVSNVLRGQGYTVLAGASGPEALAAARAHAGPIHLLVTDVVMPQMSGPQLAEALVRERPEVPVIFMSGYPDRTEGRGIPAHVPMVQKPFSLADFTRRVRAVLDAATTT